VEQGSKRKKNDNNRYGMKENFGCGVYSTLKKEGGGEGRGRGGGG